MGNYAIDDLTGDLYSIKQNPLFSIFIQNYNVVGFKFAVHVVAGAGALPGAVRWNYKTAHMPPGPRLVLNTISLYNARRHIRKLKESMAAAETMEIVDVEVIADRPPVSGSLRDTALFKPSVEPITVPPVLNKLSVFSSEYSVLPREKVGDLQLVMWPLDKLMYKGMPRDVTACIGSVENQRAMEPGFYSTETVGRMYVENFGGEGKPGGAVYSARPVRQLRFVMTSDPHFGAVLYSKVRADISAIVESTGDQETIVITREQIDKLREVTFEMETVQLALGVYCDVEEQIHFMDKFKSEYATSILAAIKEMRAQQRFINKRFRIDGVIHSGLYHDVHRMSVWAWIDAEMAKSICKRFPGLDGYINTPALSLAQYGRFGNNRINVPYQEEEVVLCRQKGAIEWVGRDGESLGC